MALNIYKIGQGYWTRVLTAVGFGVLILSGVAFIWQQLELLGLTQNRSVSTSALVTGLAQWGADAKQPVAALSAISEIKLETEGSPRIVIKDNTQKKSYDVPLDKFAMVFDPLFAAAENQKTKPEPVNVSDAVGVKASRDGVVVTYESFAARNRIYIQSIVAVIILLAAGIGGFAVMNRPKVVDFLIATEGEVRKVNWPSRKELIGATWLVICGTFLLALAIMLVDFSFLKFFTVIHVIQTATETVQ